MSPACGPFDSSVSCSTPKRQRTSYSSSTRFEKPLNHNGSSSRRKSPAYVGLSDIAHQPGLNGLPFDSPTIRRYSRANQGTIMAGSVPMSRQEVPAYRRSNDDYPTSKKTKNYICETQGLQRCGRHQTQTGHAKLGNVSFNFPSDCTQIQSYSQSAGLEKDPAATRSCFEHEFRCFSDDTQPNQPWAQARQSDTGSSLPYLDFTQPLHLRRDPGAAQASTACSSFLPPKAIKLKTIGGDGECGSNVMSTSSSSSVKQESKVPVLSLNVTTNYREALAVIDFIRCRALKRQLETQERNVWSAETLCAFDEAIRTIPRLGRAKILALTPEGRKPFGRNELISDYIYRRTGIERDRKQVSSHIQVIKNAKKVEPTLSQLLGPAEAGENLSFDDCSASWFGACLNNDVLTLYPCTPEFPFASQVLQHLPPPENDEEYLAFLIKIQAIRNSRANKRSNPRFQVTADDQWGSSLLPSRTDNTPIQPMASLTPTSQNNPTSDNEITSTLYYGGEASVLDSTGNRLTENQRSALLTSRFPSFASTSGFQDYVKTGDSPGSSFVKNLYNAPEAPKPNLPPTSQLPSSSSFEYITSPYQGDYLSLISNEPHHSEATWKSSGISCGGQENFDNHDASSAEFDMARNFATRSPEKINSAVLPSQSSQTNDELVHCLHPRYLDPGNPSSTSANLIFVNPTSRINETASSGLACSYQNPASFIQPLTSGLPG